MLLYTVMPSLNKISYLILSDLTLLKFQRQQFRKKTSCLFRLSRVLTLYLAIVSEITVPQNILLVSSQQGFDIVPSHSFGDNSTAKTSCLFRLSRVLTLYLAIVSVIIVPQKTSCLFRLSMVLTLYLAIVSVITVPQNNILLVSPEQGFAIVPSYSFFGDNSTAKQHFACFA